MTFNKNEPYNDLPLLPPKSEIETKRVLKKTALAREALGRLKASNKRLPNESVLINAIMLQEAKISSEIEHIVTTNDELYQALVSESKNIEPDTKEVLRYPNALWEGFHDLKKRKILNKNTFLKIAQTIKENDSGIRNNPGTKVVNPKTGDVIYTPPEGVEIINHKLYNLENFLNMDGDGFDLLVKMAIGHYQFEAIHPFYDGNGRTGRIINILFLILHDLLEKPVLYLSKYIIENKNQYYKKLRAVTEKQEWEEWILYMLEAVEETAKYTEQKIEDICALMSDTEKFLKEKKPVLYSKELVEILFGLPYCKRQFLVDAGIVKEKTAGKYLRELEDIGLLESIKVGKEKLYLNKKFFNLLKT